MRLIASIAYHQAPIEEREKFSNGCGPDWFPRHLRLALDKIFGHSVREACAVHDWDYAHRCDKGVADHRFWLNLQLLTEERAKDSHWTWARYVVAYFYYQAVRVFGIFSYPR